MNIIRGIGSFLLTLVIYLGLPLIGWGFGELSGFFSYPQLTGYAISIAAFGVVAAYQMITSPESLHKGKGQADKFVPRQRIVHFLVTGMLFGALVFVPFADRRGIGIMSDVSTIRWAGLVLATLGMGTIFWSGLALGRLYSPEVTLQEGHHLVTYGPYKYIRHPRYLGGMMQGMGLSLLFRSWIGLALTLVFIVIVLFRIKDEEALMSREFGQEWEDYRRKSNKLIPYLW
ncbi:MAG: isoprenylcysteine carboxylmethyltransferase family protein [Anaerolineae bacterium]|nr:isoprenylcysteine carboxylmethyltransferase family protein [Anaerolineae bacterium]